MLKEMECYIPRGIIWEILKIINIFNGVPKSKLRENKVLM